MVAPITGAWIETNLGQGIGFAKASHPSRVRGLKLQTPKLHVRGSGSHPSRVRGLKHLMA